MKKKILVMALAFALAAILVAGGTIAFFTDTDAKDNTFKMGNVDITVDEPDWEPTDDPRYPGEVIAKNPSVKNDGASPAFVRIKVEGLDALKTAGLSAEEIALYFDGAKGINAADWTLYDGYYYFNTAVDGGAATSELFDSIEIPADAAGDASGATYDVKVTAEAVQAEGIGITTPTVEEIAAWFTTCMA